MQSKQQIREHHLSMISAWQQSSQNQKQFCLQNNIAYHVFHYWYRVYRSRQNVDNGSFVAVNVSEQVKACVELHFTDGRRIIFHQPVSADFLKALIA